MSRLPTGRRDVFLSTFAGDLLFLWGMVAIKGVLINISNNMKKYLSILTIAAVLISGLSLPVAQANEIVLMANMLGPVSGQDYIAGEDIAFGASAEGGVAPYTYTWDFGDGTTGAGQSFDKSFDEVGSRTITLTVSDFADHDVVVTRSITIKSGNQNQTPTVDLKVNNQNGPVTIAPNTSFTLSWTSSDVTASTCSASGSWTGNKALSGSEATTTLASGSMVFTLTCVGANDIQASDSVTVNISTGDGGPVAPVITNLRITDVGQHSFIVRWTTDKAADSRVIYDKVSHPDISGQSEPNFGYPNSTDTFDTGTKVTEHAVTVSNLDASTTYFVRALSR